MFLVPKEQIKFYTDKGCWGSDTIVDLVYENARETPYDEALVDAPNREELVGLKPKRFTYKQVIQAVERLAIKLVEQGIGKDDIIAIQMPNVAELVISYLAAARVGAIITPIAIQYRKHEVSHVLKMCNPSCYITATNFHHFNYLRMVERLANENSTLKTIITVGENGNLPRGVLNLEEIINAPLEENHPEGFLNGKQSDANEVFSICWTSGTEAEPKGVPRSHNHWRVTGMHNPYLCQLPPRCTILASFPLINMAGIGAAFMPWVLNGGKLILHHPFDSAIYMKQIEDEKVSFTMAPPTMLFMLDKLPEWEKIDKESLSVLATGGSPLPPWLVREYKEAYNIDVVNEFASNEGFALISAPLFLSDPEERAVYFPRWGGEGVVWKGLETLPEGLVREAMKATETKLVDLKSGKIIRERGVIGELRYRSPVIFSGYWKRPDLTEKVFDEEGYYCTGDLFSIEGERMDKYLFHGRCRDIIIRGGHNISPVEIENLVGAHEKVQEVAAIGYPDSRLGERVCIVVVPKPGESISLEEILSFLREKDIAVYKLPERILIIKEMPRNAINKVEKNKLRDMVNKEVFEY